MYGVVVYAELIGTSLETWSWPKNAFNTFEFLPSANPPSGICLFYYGLDRGTMSIYKRRHKKTWQRFLKVNNLGASPRRISKNKYLLIFDVSIGELNP